MKKYTLEEVDKMDGHLFERFCSLLLLECGYERTKVTPGSGDQGIDVIAYKEGIKYGIQCKCYSSDIGNKAVQEAYSGREFYGCHIGVVITNRFFTGSAQELATRNRILLWDRNHLIELMKKAGIFAEYIEKDDGTIVFDYTSRQVTILSYEELMDPRAYENSFNDLIKQIDEKALRNTLGERINTDRQIEILIPFGTIFNQSGRIIIQPQRKIQEDNVNFESESGIVRIRPKYCYIENETCWQCTCGQPNASIASICSFCGRDRQQVKSNYQESKLQLYPADLIKSEINGLSVDEECKRTDEKIEIQRSTSGVDKYPGTTPISENDISPKRNKYLFNIVVGIVITVAAICVFIVLIIPTKKSTELDENIDLTFSQQLLGTWEYYYNNGLFGAWHFSEDGTGWLRIRKEKYGEILGETDFEYSVDEEHHYIYKGKQKNDDDKPWIIIKDFTGDEFYAEMHDRFSDMDPNANDGKVVRIE